MTRIDIINQIERMKNEQDDEEEIALLQFAADNATDEDLRIAQIQLPGRRSVMMWAEKNIGRK